MKDILNFDPIVDFKPLFRDVIEDSFLFPSLEKFVGNRWYSVASSSDGTKLVAAAYNGQLYTSTDSGVTWTARWPSSSWSSVASSADGTKLVAGTDGGQLYTSTDSGMNWKTDDTSQKIFNLMKSYDL